MATEQPPQQQPPPQPNAAPAPMAPPANTANVPAAPAVPPGYEYPNIPNLPFHDPTQLLKLLRSLPGLTIDNSNPKQDAAQTLSNLAQGPYAGQLPYVPPAPGSVPGMADPGSSSSHSRGAPAPPPALNQLAAALQTAPPAAPGQQPPPADGSQPQPPTPAGEHNPNGPETAEGSSPISQSAVPAAGGRRGRNPAIGTDEWTRQRKDNHKEVERRRRGNINDGINELGRIVPNGTGEKAKGAILARAVQYIHHLKENEARNIEKWTLEKLLMDQAMGDLQAQLEEVKRLWDEERTARTRLEGELEHLRGQQQRGTSQDEGGASAANAANAGAVAGAAVAGTKRRNDGELENAAGENPDADRDGKRQRVE